jgi:hypothetical protein
VMSVACALTPNVEATAIAATAANRIGDLQEVNTVAPWREVGWNPIIFRPCVLQLNEMNVSGR